MKVYLFSKKRMKKYKLIKAKFNGGFTLQY